MITAFPPNILICLDKKYPETRAYIQEDALQLYVDQLAEENPEAAWDTHDISEDKIVRARRIPVEHDDGETAQYTGRTLDGKAFCCTVEQFDRNGGARVRDFRITE
ncbi:MAG: hypothetical protein IJU76_05145 [Desulfovibrionaceae bacterium]|nr:hypothetical protein [Desulfovibrionaceae bacterium]